ncbi:DUF4160 domain-containing protein [Desulfobacter vibrioformis]|uniref:DUF4160 domain-containing protein n=1 Tax=Desulfobacter vibrioformis TaxID=34031 RepID=UPI002480A18C|nr:DUF4160 domain-containing protein [Desulfobacter vibrioformis]
MYYAPSEHPPPHFHVYYGEHRATVDIQTCEISQGQLPKKAIKACHCVGRTSSRRTDG